MTNSMLMDSLTEIALSTCNHLVYMIERVMRKASHHLFQIQFWFKLKTWFVSMMSYKVSSVGKNNFIARRRLRGLSAAYHRDNKTHEAHEAYKLYEGYGSPKARGSYEVKEVCEALKVQGTCDAFHVRV